jgi:transcriptional regulator with XRE-family HTH domain
MDIGHRIKGLRVKKNLTLEELASRCELTKGFLSQLERDLATPSIPALKDICDALGVTLAEFFSTEQQTKMVFGKEDIFIDVRDGCKIEWIVPNAQSNEMEPIKVVLPPGGVSFKVQPHQGEEFGMVLNGKVLLLIENQEYLLGKGQTFYLRGEYEHHLENRSKQVAEVIWVCTPPLF